METHNEPELSAEELRRIYLEEKARMEIRKKLEAEQPPQPPPPPPTVTFQAITPRPSQSNGIAALLSLVLPGAGQMYKNKVGAGLLWLLGTALGYVCFIVPGLITHVVCIFNAYWAEVGGESNSTRM